MRYLSRILTIALLTVVMPSFAQQEFVFKNMKEIETDSVYTITITRLDNGNYTIKSFNQGNASTRTIIYSAPVKLDPNNKICLEEEIDYLLGTITSYATISSQGILNILMDEDIYDFWSVPSVVTRGDWKPLYKDAYTREFNRMKQVLSGESSVQNSTNISASFEKVWVDHNVFENGVKGMRIHVKFNINGMLNKTGSAIAYFYYNNGNALKDSNKRFNTVGGNVAAWRDFTPNYERCTFNDLTIFMPYSELELSQSAQCYFYVEIKDDVSVGGNPHLLATSEKVYFDYTR